MTRKIDPQKKVRPSEIGEVTHRKGASRPPHDWPGIPGRSQEDDAGFTREGKDEAPADVTESQRELERKMPHGER